MTHFLPQILSNGLTPWGLSIQIYEPLGDILIQAIIPFNKSSGHFFQLWGPGVDLGLCMKHLPGSVTYLELLSTVWGPLEAELHGDL